MKTILLLLLFTGISVLSKGQTDPILQQRATLIMKATDSVDMDKILDLTYPKLFTIVPREQMAEALLEAFNTEEFTITIDSILVDTIYPIFTVGDGSYAKIKHSQILKMRFKEEIDTTDKESLNELLNNMKDGFPDSKVRFDAGTNCIVISGPGYMIAIKDNYAKEWCFVNLEDDDNQLISLLFNEDVVKKLKEYK